MGLLPDCRGVLSSKTDRPTDDLKEITDRSAEVMHQVHRTQKRGGGLMGRPQSWNPRLGNAWTRQGEVRELDVVGNCKELGMDAVCSVGPGKWWDMGVAGSHRD